MNKLPKPYYQDNLVTIYHGDCAEIVPQLGRFDLLLTDPPYGIGQDGGAQRRRGSKKTNGPKMGWDAERPAKEYFDIMIASTDNQIIWGGNYFADFLPASRGWIYWHKLMGGDFSDGELAWTSFDQVLKSITECNKSHGKVHPTQKPEAVIRFSVAYATSKALVSTVLDPFMGSGTTLAVCRQEGIRSVGIDREEKYCDIARQRVQQRSLFEVES
tara:strand:+ start:41 stop:685 length:645 start_codon:yes stop_codon:yes gene_type:complete